MLENTAGTSSGTKVRGSGWEAGTVKSFLEELTLEVSLER